MNITSNFKSISEKWVTFWRNLPLLQKMLLAFGVLFVFSVVIAAVTLLGLNSTTTAYKDALAQGIEIRRLSDQVEINLLSARRDGKDFLLRWEIEGYDQAYANYVTPYKQNTIAMRESIEQLAPFGDVAETLSTGDYTREQYETDIATLKKDADTYEQSFFAMVAVIEKRGADEQTGLEGELRTHAHALEGRFSDVIGLEQLEITLLQIRRNEKDYINRKDKQYIDNVHSLVSRLKDQITNTDQLDSVVKAETLAQADAYLKTFDEIVAVDQEIDKHYAELASAALAVDASAAKINSLGQQLATDDLNAAQTNSTRAFTFSTITVLIALAISFVLALVLSRQLTKPILLLTNTAQEISAGNFEIQAQVNSADEVGVLAQTFNTMTAQLGQAFTDVNRRAAELATVAEVGTATATILNTDRLLQEVVDLTKERFNLYHSHIYLLDEKGENLILTAGAGEPGRIMAAEKRSISLGQQSLVARAAREQKGVIVNDVTLAPDFLPNPLLPDTRSELAVPMIVGGKVIGVFDVQSNQVGRFADSDISIQTTLAAQVAVSLQNVRSFEQSKSQAELELLVNTIGQKIQRAATMEETLQIAIRELGVAIDATQVKATVGIDRQIEPSMESAE